MYLLPFCYPYMLLRFLILYSCLCHFQQHVFAWTEVCENLCGTGWRITDPSICPSPSQWWIEDKASSSVCMHTDRVSNSVILSMIMFHCYVACEHASKGRMVSQMKPLFFSGWFQVHCEALKLWKTIGWCTAQSKTLLLREKPSWWSYALLNQPIWRGIIKFSFCTFTMSFHLTRTLVGHYPCI